jgi:hypothetical protein
MSDRHTTRDNRGERELERERERTRERDYIDKRESDYIRSEKRISSDTRISRSRSPPPVASGPKSPTRWDDPLKQFSEVNSFICLYYTHSAFICRNINQKSLLNTEPHRIASIFHQEDNGMGLTDQMDLRSLISKN